jgi:hypothetical protein
MPRLNTRDWFSVLVSSLELWLPTIACKWHRSERRTSNRFQTFTAPKELMGQRRFVRRRSIAGSVTAARKSGRAAGGISEGVLVADPTTRSYRATSSSLIRNGEESVNWSSVSVRFPSLAAWPSLRTGLNSMITIASVTSLSRSSCGENWISACRLLRRIGMSRRLVQQMRLVAAAQINATSSRRAIQMMEVHMKEIVLIVEQGLHRYVSGRT